ncbi:oxysterol-binding protein-related protein 1-like [Gigantopelta aegis]|uniref:oxysterol-binding protein-related protein 1-like n=1 Tax=Gigantopelta aegis TaxID=1735272 RepID=UPI001B88B3C0|nr:oxysterol-binding protein-related protein 1-like [Gigantopelta aegis]
MGEEGSSSSAESELEFDSVDDELLHFSRHGNVAHIEQLLKRRRAVDDHHKHDDDVDVNCKGSQKRNRGWTPLQLAAYFGHEDTVNLLLEHGAQVNLFNGTGDTALHKAALTNRESVVTVLLQRGADVSIVNREGHTPKQVAGSPDVRRLIEAAEDHERKKLEQEFLEAAAGGHVDQIELLLKKAHPPSLTCTDLFGNTALHIGALNRMENVVVFLLQHGVDTSIKNKNDQIAADMTQMVHMKQLLAVRPGKVFQLQPQKMEGHLLKKLRLLGFRSVWVVLERGVLSYFENKADAALCRKRKGMKYLDEAKIFVPVEQGLEFKIYFSDGTTHILKAEHIDGAEVNKQKWLNALKEHIEYSTHYLHTGEGSSELDMDRVTLGTMSDVLKTAQAQQQLLKSKVTSLTQSIKHLGEVQTEQTKNIQQELESVVTTSKDVCESLTQCMTLFNQQEDLRELQLKEEREKCRVLQDGLHALAMEHHQLERSISFRRSTKKSFDTDDEEFYDCYEVNNCRFGSPEGFQSSFKSFDESMSDGPSDSHPTRSALPVPMFSRQNFSFWSILKQCIGKELSKITMPIVFNEPLSFLQRISEYMEYSFLLERASLTPDPAERMQYVAAFAVSAVSSNWERIGKPFNPLLGETFELDRPEMGFRLVSEQVSHHPPVSAFHAESQNYHFKGSLNPKLKFWGKSVEIHPKGLMTLELLTYNEVYTWHNVNCSVHNVIVGKLWVELAGTMELVNHTNKMKAVLNFKESGWFGRDLHKVEGYVYNENKKKVKALYGNWVLGLYACDPDVYDECVKTSSPSSTSDSPTNCPKPNGSSRTSSTDDVSEDVPLKQLLSYELNIPEESCLWKAKPRPYNSEEYFSFTLFALSLNELIAGMALQLPSSDCRLRPDIRLLEEGKIDSAAEEKNRLEEKQRAAKKERKKKNEEWNPKWFKYAVNPATGKEDWMFCGEYWLRNWSRSPDIF